MDGAYQFDKDDNLVVEIKELPIGIWTKDYKEFLETLLEGDNPIIQDFKEFHTNNKVHFRIKFKEGNLNRDPEVFIKIMRLRSTI